jgi:hypothetical protein
LGFLFGSGLPVGGVFAVRFVLDDALPKVVSGWLSGSSLGLIISWVLF